MKRIALCIAFCIVCASAEAQEHHFDLGYRYLYAPAWDRMVQTYTFSRPFLDDTQPLLQHGFGAGYARTFSSERRIRSGVAMGYDRFISQAEATGLESRIRLHQLRISYTVRFLQKKLESPWQLEAGVGMIGHHLSRLVNDAPIADEEQRPRSLSVGADVNVLVGRRFTWGAERWIVPYVALNVAPYVYQPTAEVVLNQTRGLVAGNGTFLLLVQAGMRLTLGPSSAVE